VARWWSRVITRRTKDRSLTLPLHHHGGGAVLNDDSRVIDCSPGIEYADMANRE
jgi:hypothetical protein